MNTRLPGHELQREGAPHRFAGRRLVRDLNRIGTGGPGRALCSCGAYSAALDSAAQRKAWHRDHKAAVQAQAARSAGAEAGA